MLVAYKINIFHARLQTNLFRHSRNTRLLRDIGRFVKRQEFHHSFAKRRKPHPFMDHRNVFRMPRGEMFLLQPSM